MATTLDPATSIELLELDVRPANALLQAGITTLGQLTSTTYERLGRTRNLGPLGRRHVMERLAERGLLLAGEKELSPPHGDDLDELATWADRSQQGSTGPDRRRLARKMLAAIAELRKLRGPAETTRERWTDARLDEMEARLVKRDADFARLEAQTAELHSAMKKVGG